MPVFGLSHVFILIRKKERLPHSWVLSQLYCNNSFFKNRLCTDACRVDVRESYDSDFKFFCAVASISLIRFNWFTSLAPGS